MNKVKKLVDAGLSITSAIKEALGISLLEFSEKYAIPHPTVSELVNGARRPTATHLDAFIAELGGTADEWRELLWLAGKPDPAGKAE